MLPDRVQINVLFGQAQARTLPSLATDLQMSIQELLTSGLDKYALNQTGKGLLVTGTAPSAPSAVADWDDFTNAISSNVDGIYSRSVADCRILLRSTSYGLAAKVYRGNNSELSAANWLANDAGGVMASAYPASASNDDQALVIKGRWPRSTAQVLWDGLTLEDVYSGAQESTVRLVAAAYTNQVILRPDVYKRVAFQNQ